MKNSRSTKHHEESPMFQEKLFSDVKKLCNSLSQHGNPFKDRTDELINIKTNDVMNSDVITKIFRLLEKASIMSMSKMLYLVTLPFLKH